MNNKNIIIAGAIAVGLYLFSQTKKTAQRIRPTATSSIKQRTAQKIGKIIGKKVAQKVDISKMPVAQIRDMIAHAAAQKKTGKEVAALKAEEARRVARANAAYKAAQKRIGMSISRTAYIAARRKAAARKAVVRKAAAQKIGKIIGKKVAQKIPLNIKIRRAVIARHAKRHRPQIQRPRQNKKQIASRLFSGSEKSRIIPYSESSKHSYYGPKSHKLQNEGYRVESNKRLRNSVEAYHDAAITEVLSNPKLWKK